jgi:hypothetical protein
MKSLGLVVAVVSCAAMVFAQSSHPDGSGQAGQAYHPAVPQASGVAAVGNEGWWGQPGGGTVAGSAMNGMANVISAAGDYNLSTSAAAVNMTQAQRQEIENRSQWTQTYFDMRAVNRSASAAERGPNLTVEQLARIAHEGAPTPLTPSQVDPVTGRIDWPTLLQTEAYAPQRAVLDHLVAKRATLGGLGYPDREQARDAIDAIMAALKGQIRDIPPAQYVASRNFLGSLLYATSKSQLD